MNEFRWSQGTNGLVAFDLETFLNMAQRSRKWQCPHSMRHSRVQELQVDTYITQILERLKVFLPSLGFIHQLLRIVMVVSSYR